MKNQKRRNPVAHFNHKFNKPSVQTDKKKAFKKGIFKYKKQAYLQAA